MWHSLREATANAVATITISKAHQTEAAAAFFQACIRFAESESLSSARGGTNAESRRTIIRLRILVENAPPPSIRIDLKSQYGQIL